MDIHTLSRSRKLVGVSALCECVLLLVEMDDIQLTDILQAKCTVGVTAVTAG